MVKKILTDQERIENRKKAVAKYDKKVKKLTVGYKLEDAARIEEHYRKKGFNSANSYLKYLIDKDMQEAEQ